MVSLPVVILSALVLALSGVTVVLGARLHGVKKSKKEVQSPPAPEESARAAVLRKKTEAAAEQCREIKRSLIHICAVMPAGIPGLSIERVRLLCAGELKDAAAALCSTLENGCSDRLAPAMGPQELELLDTELSRLAAITEEVKNMDQVLTLRFKSWSVHASAAFDDEAQKLAAISRELDALHQKLQTCLLSASQKLRASGTMPSAEDRIRSASRAVSDPTVRAAMADLELLARRSYDGLDRQTKARLGSHYLGTLELVTGELGRAEQAGEDTETRIALSLRVIQVLSDVFAAGRQAQCEGRERDLEAEVTALERLTAMRGEKGGRRMNSNPERAGNARLLGRWGEARAADWLRAKGYQILASGYRCRFGEIDLIAKNEKYICFTEVKLRNSAGFAAAREFVDRRKQERVRLTAEHYLSEHPSALQPRFDVAEVYAPAGISTKNPRIIYLENAF